MKAHLEQEKTDAAIRLCARYVHEVVVAFGLCPWAEATVRAGRVGWGVCWSEVPTPADCASTVDGWPRSGPEAVEIGFLIFPGFIAGAAAFDGFAERVRRAQRGGASTAPGPSSDPPDGVRFLVAAFHPAGAASFSGPHQLVSFLRRTPDPTLQFVRADLIDRLKETQPDISDAVAHRNHQAMLDDSDRQRLESAIQAIHADRKASYE